MRVKNVLVTTDFSELARVAYSRAVFFARRHGARLHLLHIVQPLPPHSYLAPRPLPALPQGTLYDGIEDELCKEAKRPEFEGATVKTRLCIEYSPDEALAEYVKDEAIDLVIAATHGRTGLSHMLMGSFAERLVRTSPVPVLTVHERGPSWMPPRRVLVPFDFSANARTVFPHLRWLDHEYACEFEFVYVRELYYPFQDGAAISREIQDWNLNCAGRAREEFRHLQSGELRDVKASLTVLDGDPAKVLVRRAEEDEVSWIVMATHGWSGIRRFFLGSVAEKVVRAATCCVLTVRPARIEQGAASLKESENVREKEKEAEPAL